MFFLGFYFVLLFSQEGVIANKPTYFDLTYSINNDTIYFPGQKVEFELHKDIKNYTKSGYWYASFSLCMGEHGGTHVDAPYHFYEKGWTLDEIPPSHLIDVPATVVDVEESVFNSEVPGNFLLRVEHLLQHETKHGQIPSSGVVLLHTGWSKYWLNKSQYLGFWNDNNLPDSDKARQARLRFPGCSLEAAKWLRNERNVVGFGIDTASVDVGTSKDDFPVHVFFGEEQVYNIENVANLHLVKKAVMEDPECNLHLFVLPLKITGGTGGPTRILAYCKH